MAVVNRDADEQCEQVSRDGKYYAMFQELTAKPIQEQADAFTRAFCSSLKDKFPEISQQKELFESALKINKARVAKGGIPDEELEEDLAHKFFEQLGQTMTVLELRDILRHVDLDRNNKMCFVEYLLWKYNKSVAALFAEIEQEDLPILGELDSALADVNARTQARKDHDDKIVQLEFKVEAGGFHGAKAAAELSQLRQKRWTQENMISLVSEMNAKGVQKQADVAMKNYKEAQEESWKQEQTKRNSATEENLLEQKKGRNRLADRIGAMGLN